MLCKLLLERFAELAAVIELLLRAADEFAKLVADLSLFEAVRVPAVLAPPAAALDPERLLPLVMLALFAFEGSTLLAP